MMVLLSVKKVFTLVIMQAGVAKGQLFPYVWRPHKWGIEEVFDGGHTGFSSQGYDG
jgi:hypothetical protein